MTYPHNILMQVQKPGRYVGGESGMVIKEYADGLHNFCLCFPDVYEVGMSWSGLNILYSLINERQDFYCQRAFAPWGDMETLLREHALPLKTLERGESLADMDIVGFSFNHELGYTNFLNMLDLCGIPLLTSERGESYPVICAGGPSACNPEPISDFVDFFFIGEAEAGFDVVLEVFAANKKKNGTKDDFLAAICGLSGVYVPKFYDVAYGDDGLISDFSASQPFAPKMIEKACAPDLDSMYSPSVHLVPNLESVHDRVALEIFRGCKRRCRFCQAGYIYSPVREHSVENLMQSAEKCVNATGYDEISLLSLSTGDYSYFAELTERAMAYGRENNVSLSLPSLRIDAFSLELMGRIAGARKSGLTFAPEAGSQRLRDIIRKNLTEEEILEGCRLAFLGGWTKVKLYFMLGLPFENDEDIQAIADLADKIVNVYYSIPKEQRGKGLQINLSASCFVPKPHTPFQFAPQSSFHELLGKQQKLKMAIRSRQVKFSYHNADGSLLEASLARGDRRVGRAILAAYKLGARFDSWSEKFDFGIWTKAFESAGLSMEFYGKRARDYDEILPWDHIHTGASRELLEREMKLAERINDNG